MVETATALVAAGGLALFYFALGSEWPENYSTLSSAVEHKIRWNLLRYFLFRTVPVLVAALLAVVMSNRQGGNGNISALIFAAVHYATTHGRALVLLIFRRSTSQRQVSLLFYHLLMLFVIGSVSAAALWLSRWAEFLVPPPREFVYALWTAVFVSIIAAVARRAGTFGNAYYPNVETIIRDVGQRQWDAVDSIAAQNDCDPIFMRAVIAAECIQRPRWVRALERAKGVLIRRGTYGVAQVTAGAPVSDLDSIRALARSYRGYYPLRDEKYGQVLRGRLAFSLERHNSSPVFIETAIRFYDVLCPYAIESSVSSAKDRRPCIDVLSVGRVRGEWEVQGTCYAPELVLTVTRIDMFGEVDLEHLYLKNCDASRETWLVRLPVDTRLVLAAIYDLTDNSMVDGSVVMVSLMR